MNEPTIDEMIEWLNGTIDFIDGKTTGISVIAGNVRTLKAIRAILEQHRDAVVISKAQWAVLCELNIRGTSERTND